MNSKLPPFDFAKWANGMDLDFNGKRWGGKGMPSDGKVNKHRCIRTRVRKQVKSLPAVTPAIAALTRGDSGGRTLDQHRAIIAKYGEMYDKGISPLTGIAITDGEELKRCASAREDKPWSKQRGAASTDNDGLALLMQVFKAQHDASSNDDEDFSDYRYTVI